MKGIYLDHAATTPMHPEVLEAMLPYYRESFGNASSLHAFGQAGRKALDRARASIAGYLGCRTNELTFTSGGTESDNTAIFGAIAAQGGKGHILTTRIEHHAVLNPCERLEMLGCDVTYLEPDQAGLISPEQVEQAIRPDTALISVMFGNNEVGTLQPIEAIGRIARSRGIAFHVDAVQALGKVSMNLSQLPVDLMSFSAHKINGPKGIGALYVSSKQPIAPLLYGGSQERKRRPGTENVAGIAGFAKALELAIREFSERTEHAERLRSAMLDELASRLGTEGFIINGHQTLRLPNILNISFPGTDSETMLMNLDLAGIAASSGSACTSGSLEVSHVLEAMRLPESVTQSAVRFSFGMGNSMEEIKTAAEKVATIVNRLRKKEV